MNRIAATIVLLGVLLSHEVMASEPAAGDNQSTPSLSEPDDATRSEASTRFARGLMFYEEGDYALALIEFERAYQLVPDYRVLYNVGQVSIQLSRFARARIALTQFIEAGGDKIPAERQAAVQADLTMLEARTAHLEINSNVDGAQVLVDELPAGMTPLTASLLLDAGEHRVVLKKEGYLSQTKHLTLAGADAIQLDVALILVPAQAPVVVIRDRTPPPVREDPVTQVAKEPTNAPLIAGWAISGALVGGSAVMGVLGLVSSKNAQDIKDSPNPDRDEYNAQQTAAKNRYLAADILAIGAVVGLGTSLYFTLRPVSRSKEKSKITSARLDLSPSQISFTGVFR